MRISNTMLTTVFLGLLTSGTLTSAQAAPLPTNIATMKSMSSSDAVQVRWGGWRGGGWRGGGWGLGAAAAGAVVGGAIASGAYYGGYPYGYGGYPYYGDAYAGAYGYDSCSPGYGYGGYPYRRY